MEAFSKICSEESRVLFANTDEYLNDASASLPIDKAIVLLSSCRQLIDEVDTLQNSQSLLQHTIAVVLFWKYTSYQKETSRCVKKIKLLMDNIEQLISQLNDLWQDPKSSGVTDSEKVSENQRLVERIHSEKSSIIDNIVGWRLVTLAMIGDRLQPALLIAPYVRKQMTMTDIEKTHLVLHQLSRDLKKIISHTLVDREVLNHLIYRLRNLCISIEENAPQKTDFAFLYTSVE